MKLNNYYIDGFASSSPGVPSIFLFKKHFQFIKTNKIKNQALKKPLGMRKDPLPVNKKPKIDTRPLSKGLPIQRRNVVKAATSIDYSISRHDSARDSTKNNDNPHILVKHYTEVIKSSNFEGQKCYKDRQHC